MFGYLTTFFGNPNVLLVIKGLYYSSPVWLTFILLMVAWNLWITYARAKYIASQDYVLLEIKLPKEIFKSPLSMEFLFNMLHQGFGEEKLKMKFDRWPPVIKNDYYWKGSVRPWTSLEICAINGKVRFFIWGRAGNRGAIEAQLYSQFPGIEVTPTTDYTLPISYDTNKYSFWVRELELTKADPFPLKTYIDYGMDKDPKEEYRIDPLTPLIEFLGSLPANQTVWIQIGITAHKKTDKDPKTGKDIDKKWEVGAQEEIQKILDKAKPPKPKEGETPTSAPRSLTKGEGEVIAALERSISKRGFDTGIRLFYFAPKDVFNQGYSGGVIAGFTHLNSNNLNGFKPRDEKHYDKDWKKSEQLHAYKNRGFFWNEFKTQTFVLNTEELATIYHFPSGALGSTTAVDRIESRKAEAPANLPQ